ncbi:MAG: hypothetical protein HUU18_02775 [Phycisphaerales bacterium]|jgi:hypothetical protein|nr:hypothetical protein [Phycisphaerales bacterium]
MSSAGTTGMPDARLYDGEAESLLSAELSPDRVSLLPVTNKRIERAEDAGERIRILWGQDLLRDLLDGRYRTVVVGVNDHDNSHGIIAQMCELVSTSQWTARSVTSYAKMFHDAVSIHAAGDKEPYVLKFDLDSLLVLAVLRPKGRDHFTLDDLSRGFKTVVKMLRDRRERWPCAAVSFLNAKANRLVGGDGKEPSFEGVLRTMFEAGFRGDVYASPSMWRLGHVGVFPSYPFPAGVDRMRAGSS